MLGIFDGAQEAIALGYKACFLLSGLALVLAVFASKVSLVDAVLFGALGEGARRKSPATAVIAAIWMCLNIVASVMTRGPLVGVIPIIPFACLVSGVRGAFAYRRQIRKASRAGQAADEVAV